MSGMNDFEQWWNASKYMQVVFSNENIKRVALDGWQAARQSTKQILDEWQLIETAPKNGTHIILFGDNRVTEGKWLDDYYPKEAEFHATTGEYLGEFETGECIKGCWMSFDGGFTDEHPATHWKPLPNKPDSFININYK